MQSARKLKTAAQVYDQHQRIFRAYMARGTRKAAIAHPETGGNELLIHNWGNDAARAVWRETWAAYYRTDAAYKALYDAAFHRQYHTNCRNIHCVHCLGSNA